MDKKMPLTFSEEGKEGFMLGEKVTEASLLIGAIIVSGNQLMRILRVNRPQCHHSAALGCSWWLQQSWL